MPRRSEDTRERILQAAAEAFAENGYDATGVAEICQRAGVSKGAFYHHFPSKQALFLDLVNGWLAGLDEQLASLRTGETSAPEELLHMAALARLVFVAAEDQLPMFLEFWARASRDPEIWQATIAPYRRYHDFFASLVREGIAEGSFRPVDPQTAAYAIVALATGVILQGLMDPQAADWGQVLQESVRLLLQGLSKNGGNER